MTPRTSAPRQDPAVSHATDASIEAPGDWRSTTLAGLRAVILSADASIVEEVKWKKPSRPMGAPVWSRGGNICIGEALKSAVRLTFPKGALLKADLPGASRVAAYLLHVKFRVRVVQSRQTRRLTLILHLSGSQQSYRASSHSRQAAHHPNRCCLQSAQQRPHGQLQLRLGR